MDKINFFQAITADKGFHAVRFFDDYFSYKGKKYKVIKKNNKNNGFLVEKTDKKANSLLTALKIVSWIIPVFPLIMLIGKALARASYKFYKIESIKMTRTPDSDAKSSKENAQTQKPVSVPEIVTQNKKEDRTSAGESIPVSEAEPRITAASKEGSRVRKPPSEPNKEKDLSNEENRAEKPSVKKVSRKVDGVVHTLNPVLKINVSEKKRIPSDKDFNSFDLNLLKKWSQKGIQKFNFQEERYSAWFQDGFISIQKAQIRSKQDMLQIAIDENGKICAVKVEGEQLSTNFIPKYFEEQAASCILTAIRESDSEELNQTQLLKLAFHDSEPEDAFWHIQNGASVEELKSSIAMANLSDKSKKMLCWLEHVSLTTQSATPENLDRFAVEMGFGYKAANLLVMKNKAEDMSAKLKIAQVKVPPFLPVSDFEMSHYIRKNLPDVFTLWEEFVEKGFAPEAKRKFCAATTNEKATEAGLKVTDKGQYILQEIRKKITGYFSRQSYQNPRLLDWLKKENPEFVIVRSTGKEDSDTFSNAGGNESIPFVKPSVQAISEAIGEVIASYFGEKSISQRILSGDRSLFESKKPFMPVLIQEMIGENRKEESPSAIPRSGVIFTRQSDKAKNVATIETGLGDNGGIVSGNVAVDSYSVSGSVIHSVIRNKKSRYVPQQTENGKWKVSPINNNTKLSCSPALEPSLILAIKSVADDVSEFYAQEEGLVKPMDIEYTVKLTDKGSDQPVIYLLQARPLLNTQQEKKTKASYLDLKALKIMPQEALFTGDVLLDGNAYVRTITNSKSIIFKDNLAQGEYAFSHSENPSEKKVIVIKQTAPATSHEAVVLRPKGVAVMVVSDPDEYAALKQAVNKASEGKPLLVDTQRGTFAVCDKAGSAEGMIKEGLISYPIPLEVSVPPSEIIKLYHEKSPEVKKAIDQLNNESEQLIKELQGGKNLLPISKKGADGYDIKELLEIMAMGKTPEAKRALATLLRLMKNRLVKSMYETEQFRKEINQPMFQIFEAVVKATRQELIPALENHDPQTLERLYSIKYLDAMLFQKTNLNIMEGRSYYQVLSLDKAQQKAIAETKDLFKGTHGEHLIYLYSFSRQAYNETSRAQWQKLVKLLATLESQKASQYISRLIHLTKQLNDLNVSDKWLNTEFVKVWEANKHQSKETKIKVVIDELEKEFDRNETTCSRIEEWNKKLDPYKQATASWRDPAYAKNNAKALMKAFTTEFGFDKTGKSKNSIAEIYKNSNPLGKLALLQYIRDAITIYDEIIKTVTGSDQFPTDQEKAELFADLLEAYLEMMEAAFKLIDEAAEGKLLGIGDEYLAPVDETHVDKDEVDLLDDYIKKLKSGTGYAFGFPEDNGRSGIQHPILHRSDGLISTKQKLKAKELNPIDQLQARGCFSVDAVVVGSKAETGFSFHWPNTLEEYFTTFHQNIEKVVKFLNKENGLNTNILSNSAKEICSKAETLFKQGISYMNFESGKLQVGYQVPLGQHSLNFAIAYCPEDAKKGFEITFQSFGINFGERWEKGAAFGAFLAYTLAEGFAGDNPPKINYNDPASFTIELHISHSLKNIDQLLEAFDNFIHSTDANSYKTVEKFVEIIESTMQPLQWNALNPECFKYTLYTNKFLIEKFLKEGSQKLAADVALKSVQGMAYYGLKDYGRKDDSLKEIALQTLINSTSPTILEDIQKVIDDPEVQSLFPDLCTELKQKIQKVA